MMRPRISNIDGVTVVDINHSVNYQDWNESANDLTLLSIGIFIGLHGENITGHFVRDVPRISDVKRVISHGSDRYSTDVVSNYDQDVRRQESDPRMVRGLALNGNDYIGLYGPMAAAVHSVLKSRFGDNPPEISDPSGLLLFRKDRATLIETKAYSGLYQLDPNALNTIILMHLDVYTK